jgi:hypothetical protein
MPATQTAKNPPSFETVWAALQETDRLIKESKKETDQLKESQKETARQMKETDRLLKERQEETNRQIKEIGKRFGDFTNRFGEVIEYMIAPNLLDKFQELGFDFQEASTNHKVRNNKNNIRLQIDVFLQNGNTAMLVEIKTKLTISDINDHIKRLEKMRTYADLRSDKRTFLGAVAGVVVEDNEREYALSQGFFLIEPSGENFNITPPHDKPKEW